MFVASTLDRKLCVNSSLFAIKDYVIKLIEVSCAMKLVIIDSGVNFTDDQQRYQLMAVLKLITYPGVALLDHSIDQDLSFLSNTLAFSFTSIHAIVTMWMIIVIYLALELIKNSQMWNKNSLQSSPIATIADLN